MSAEAIATPDSPADQGPGMRRWLMPAIAGASMLIPIKFWDLALERELSQAAIRRVCQARGMAPSAGAVSTCSSRIFRALTRGYRGSWAVNAALVGSYFGGPLLLNGLLAAGGSHLTQRIVEMHLDHHPSLETLTEAEVRRALRAMLPTGSRPTAHTAHTVHATSVPHAGHPA